MIFLLFVLVLTGIMQVSRSDMLLQWNQSEEEALSSMSEPRDALTAEQADEIGLERFLIVFDPENQASLNIKENAEQTIAGMKKQFQSVKVDADLTKGEEPDAVIVAVSDLTPLVSAEWLEGYVARGGHVLFTMVLENNEAFNRFYRKLDILEIGDYLDSENVQFKTGVLLGYANDSFEDMSLQNTVLHVRLGDNSRILATVNNDVPLLWEASYGNGTFLVFNGTMLQEKISRGLFAGSIGYLLPDFIYPVLNAKVVYIDDFPAPFPKGVDPRIYQDYQLDLPGFFKKVWWSDMIRLARAYNLKYTGALIVTYTDRVSQPFNWEEDGELSNLILFGRELLKEGGEIGVHGYNHQSLTSEARVSEAFGYKRWGSTEEMVASLRALKEFTQAAFPNYPFRTYVPPSNALSGEMRQVIKNALPDLTNISSLYGTDGRNVSYVQEYELASDGVVELPRVTYGYNIGEYDRWLMANALTSEGIFSHFVHPDDVIDRERSYKMSWEDLSKSFEEYLLLVQERYGWLRSMTASEAAVEVKRRAISQPYFERHANGITGSINQFTGDLYFLLRTEKKISRLENCELTRIDEGVYLVRAKRETFSVEWKDA